jgi:hypothetical protein
MDPLRVHAAVKQFGAATGYAADFAVDAIGMNLIAPASELARGGIQPVGRSIFELADRSQREFAFSFAEIEILGERTVGRAFFGPEDTEPMLGNLLFESVGFVIDPETQDIRRRPLRL